MNALAVLVLLLFLILLALSLTVWAAISMGTKRRLANSASDDPARAGRPDRTTAPRTRTHQSEQVAPGPQRNAVVRAVVGTNTGSGATEGRLGRGERKQPVARDPSELPWLRPPSAAETAGEEFKTPSAAPAERSPGRPQRPRVVVTDADPARAPEREQPQVTVTPSKVERDAFDRFLDAERDKK